MSIEVTPESLRAHAAWLDDHHGAAEARVIRCMADRLERLRRPLPTVPGWYPSIVVERGGESCTGALLTPDSNWWCTAEFIDGNFLHRNTDENTIRWAEQDGTTPGQTLWQATRPELGRWTGAVPDLRARFEQRANAVLAAHGTPTLTPVGEHPEPGTRGLLPVVLNEVDVWWSATGSLVRSEHLGRKQDIFADPRPDGAHE